MLCFTSNGIRKVTLSAFGDPSEEQPDEEASPTLAQLICCQSAHPGSTTVDGTGPCLDLSFLESLTLSIDSTGDAFLIGCS